MIGRISSYQSVLSFLSDLNTNQNELARASRRVSTGKQVFSPSDDPVGVAVAMGLRRDLAASSAWSRNIEDSLSWLSATDTALGQALNVIQRGSELAVQGGNGTLSAGARALIADEVDTLRNQFVEIGNASLGGRYLFAGTAINTAPFDPSTLAANLPINTGLLRREVAQGSEMTINITADRLQDPAGATPDIFTTLTNLGTALRNNDSAAIGAALTELQAHQDNISALRAEGAAKINRLEATLGRFAIQDIAVTQQLSDVEDADMARAITDLTMRESVLRASLSVGSRVIPPSLVDFLS